MPDACSAAGPDNESKTNPRQTPTALYAALGISRAMLYKDRKLLARLGFASDYDRWQQQFIITQDRFLPVLNLSTSAVLALIMAVRQLSSSGDSTLTYDAIAVLRKVIATSTPMCGHSFSPPSTTSCCRKGLAAM